MSQPKIIAFASEADSERALRDALAPWKNCEIWPGNAEQAAETMTRTSGNELVIVDMDETGYPVGAIYELAAVCEVGTKVIAYGTNNNGQMSRQLLLAGVEDYLPKPLQTEQLRASVEENLGRRGPKGDEGTLVGVFGPRGTGRSTVAAMLAMTLARRGTYISVLDLDRSFSALAFALDVETPPGLEELMSAVARASLHPEMIDAVRRARTERLSVYGYARAGTEIPPAPAWAICELATELQRRSRVVIIEGCDEPKARQALLGVVDVRVVVYEPTESGALEAERTGQKLKAMRAMEWPVIEVQNHTRVMSAATGAERLKRMGVRPDISIPYEKTIPRLNDDGWPKLTAPKSVEKSIEMLSARIMGTGENTDEQTGTERRRSEGSGMKGLAELAGTAKKRMSKRAKRARRSLRRWQHAASGAVHALTRTKPTHP